MHQPPYMLYKHYNIFDGNYHPFMYIVRKNGSHFEMPLNPSLLMSRVINTEVAVTNIHPTNITFEFNHLM